MDESFWRRFDVRDLPRSVLALYAAGILLGAAGVLSVLIWYTGSLEPTPEQVAAPQPTVQAQPTPASATPAAGAPAPTAIPPTTAPTRLIVANTGGLGAVVRAQPSTDAPVVVAVPEGTALESDGPDVQADGRTWRHVRDDQGNQGYIAGELVRNAAS